jgi:hypothetical protein
MAKGRLNGSGSRLARHESVGVLRAASSISSSRESEVQVWSGQAPAQEGFGAEDGKADSLSMRARSSLGSTPPSQPPTRAHVESHACSKTVTETMQTTPGEHA